MTWQFHHPGQTVRDLMPRRGTEQRARYFPENYPPNPELYEPCNVIDRWTMYDVGAPGGRVELRDFGTERGKSTGPVICKTGNNDPSGGWIDLPASVRAYTVAAYDQWELHFWYNYFAADGGGAVRVGIVTTAGDGYSFQDQGSYLAVEKRNAFIGAAIGSPSSTAYTRTNNTWRYGVLGKINAALYALSFDESMTTWVRHDALDVSYPGGNSFTRIQIFGGQTYYVDEIKFFLSNNYANTF